MRIGIVFNPAAGRRERFKAIALKLLERCQEASLITGGLDYGENWFDHGDSLEIVEIHGLDFSERLKSCLDGFLSRKVDLIVGVGGDGFLAHIGAFIIEGHYTIPLLGICGGTANVGPLLGFNEDTLERLDLANMNYAKVSALAVESAWRRTFYAFNDIVIGDTFLGTIEGKMTNLSARAFVEDGIKLEKKPSEEITTADFALLKNGVSQPLPCFKTLQIVASPLLESRHYNGKAITGALCLAPFFPVCGAVSLLDTVIIDSKLESPLKAVSIQQLLFGEKDHIAIKGLSSYLVVDGNVCYYIGGEISISCLPEAVSTARLRN